MISLTPSASKNILEQMQYQKIPAVGLKLGVRNSGCNGFVYDLSFAYDNEDLSNYLLFESNYVTIYVNKMHINYLSGTTIDFVKEGLNQSFVYNNPNKAGSCGCGISFNIE